MKHDEDCMRRRETISQRLMCTCGLTDEEVEEAIRQANDMAAERYRQETLERNYEDSP